MSLSERFFQCRNRALNSATRRRGLLALAAACLAIFCFSATARAQEFDFGADDEEPVAAAPDVPAPAAEASADTTAETTQTDNYLVWMFRSLGWFFSIVFLLLSITMVALIVINIVALRRHSIAPEELAAGFGRLLDENKFQEAYEFAKEDESLLGRVLATGLARMPSGFEKATQAMEDVEQEETMRLEHQLGYLALIGNLSPMIGLFGTVIGMIASFQAIATGGAAPSPQKLAEGIATALFTTGVGLAIALPALAAFDILKNRLARYVLDVAVISDSFMGRFSEVKSGR
ncbi:MAG: MotA/TolQ/ExbB proton channel family protein [Thermoguttaceae bacterium]|jgi:biopolymer transport protein ExbB